MVHEYSLALLLGVLGGFHCVGMCGGLIASLSIGRGRMWWPGMVAYQVARVAVYILLGVAVAFAGTVFADSGIFADGQKALSFIAGLLILLFALQFGGFLPETFGALLHAYGLSPTLMQGAVKRESVRYWVALGTANGLFPCGLVYAALAMALETGDPLPGGLTMLFFGLGPVPWLFGVAWAMKRITPAIRDRFIGAAAVAVALYGLFLMLKSTPLWSVGPMVM